MRTAEAGSRAATLARARPRFFVRLVWYFFTIFLIFHRADAGTLLGLTAVMLGFERITRGGHERLRPLRYLAWILAFSSLRALLVHRGERVLFALPEAIPWIGGNVTLEGLAEAWTIGLQVFLVVAWTLLAVRFLPAHEWMRLFPARLRDLAVLLLVSVKMIPHLRQTFFETRRMYRARGREFRTARSHVPLVATWIHRSIERGLVFAEVLAIRGYGNGHVAPADPERDPLAAGLQAVGVVVVAAGVVALGRGFIAPVAWAIVSLWIVAGEGDD